MEAARRPIQARSLLILQTFSAWLAKTSVTPNQISVFSVVCSAVSCAFMILGDAPYRFVIAALFIQARLLCNVVDGLVAIEGNKKSVLGALYNEFPDRVADTFIIVGAGYAIGVPWLGWSGALLAALTAYVRVFGGALGLAQDFRGPMAKQHRMAVLSAGCLFCSAELAIVGTGFSMIVALTAVALGSALTCWTRTAEIAKNLNRAAL